MTKKPLKTRLAIAGVLVLSWFAPILGAQSTDAAQGPEWHAQPQKGFLSHIWLSGEFNSITQGHPPFRSLYSGPNSFRATTEVATSRVLTLYTGIRLTKMTDLLFDVEETNGHNVSNSLGLGGFTNADTVGVPNNHPYIARAIFHQIIPLSSDYVQVERDPLHLADRLPARRVELFAGKVNMVDFFDVSGIASDSHLQFLNWAIENNAAYGYPADSRGYTDAFLVEYHDHAWAIRFAQAWQAIAESPDKLDADIGRSVSQHIEFEIPTNRITKQSGLIRSLAFFDNGTLGIYRDAIDAYLAGIEPVPEIDAYRRPGQLHYGFGIGLEQEVSPTVRIFGRFGWAEGHKQSTAFAEVDQTFAGGFDMLGRSWRRPEDRVGAGFVSSALSGDHRRYLALGGLGFALGDGALNYGREQIFETFYNARILNGIYVAADLQAIWNPGYNRDRGPIIVAAMRLFLTGALYSHPQ